jgi:alpha-galactosidase
MYKSVYILFPILLWCTACNDSTQITSGNLILEFDQMLQSRVNYSNAAAGSFNDRFTASEYIETRENKITEFRKTSLDRQPFTDRAGSGTNYEIRGIYDRDGNRLEKIIRIRSYDSIPGFLVFRVSYVNKGEKNIRVLRWINHRYSIHEPVQEPAPPYDFWSFQGSSSSARADWILPLEPGFYKENYMGMNNTDYGGGIPVADIWRHDAGIAVGHLEMTPELVSFPVWFPEYEQYASLMIARTFDDPLLLFPGDTLVTCKSFVSVHRGDCFATLRKYSAYMQDMGIRFAEREEAALEPIWCAWGYERDFTAKEIEGTLPKVKELGIKWAVIDDGYQQAEGDWDVNRKKFPGGDRDMRRLVEKIHSYGLKAKIWWAPLAVDPCSKLYAEYPDIILYTRDWAPQYITWWDAWYMAPTSEKTIQLTRDVIHMFMEDWDIDGLKCDGQHMNAVPPDYHPGHGLDYPEQAPERLPLFFKTIYQTARSIKPDAVVENCPCGCCMSYFNLPYINQAVSSDPLSSWQIRLKGKVYRALSDNIVYYGDHVELSDNGSDFASTIGIGGVPGTKFTWPADNPSASGSYLLTPEKEATWKKWFALYNGMMLSMGTYLGDLYDIGFDKPETHVIKKDGNLYFAFYSDEWDGPVGLRGLEPGREYRVFDYVNETDMGTVSGDDPSINVHFRGSLLIELK